MQSALVLALLTMVVAFGARDHISIARADAEAIAYWVAAALCDHSVPGSDSFDSYNIFALHRLSSVLGVP